MSRRKERIRIIWRDDDTLRAYLLPDKRGINELVFGSIGGVIPTIITKHVNKVLIPLDAPTRSASRK